MIVVASTDQPLEPRAPAIDRAVRWAVAAALMLLLVAAADPFIARMAENSARITGVVPRLFAFFCIALQILILNGRSNSRPSRAELLCACVSTGLVALALLPAAVAVRGESELAVFNAIRATAQALCAVSAGLLLSRQLKTAGELLAFLACLVAADVWINSKFVPDKAALDHPLALLRQPWPPLHVRLIPAPALPEILALSALVGAGARLQLPLAAMLIGVASGYCAAAFWGFASQPMWPKASVLMITTGALIACWPDLEISVRDLVRAMLLAFSLMLVLSLLSYIKQTHEIPPKPRTDLLNRSAI
jgi:hypothetical protein